MPSYVVYFNVTALTVTNVSIMFEGMDLERLCDILDISPSKRRELEASFSYIEQQREGAIKFWITTDPLASWRRIVDRIYVWGYGDERAIGDRLRHHCKELTGMCVCIYTTPHYE